MNSSTFSSEFRVPTAPIFLGRGKGKSMHFQEISLKKITLVSLLKIPKAKYRGQSPPSRAETKGNQFLLVQLPKYQGTGTKGLVFLGPGPALVGGPFLIQLVVQVGRANSIFTYTKTNPNLFLKIIYSFKDSF